MKPVRWAGIVASVALVWACSSDDAATGSGTDGVGGGGAAGANMGGAGANVGGAGAQAAGGQATGGQATGGQATGGQATGGQATGGQATGGQGGDPGCTWAADQNPCGSGFYCATSDCTVGTCQPVPNNDDAAQSPVCGCDGVTYWNANTAAAHAMATLSPGVCTPGVSCASAVACPTGLFCNGAVLNAGMCNVDEGTCWGMPDTCNQGDSAIVRRCTAQTQDCVSQCEAIKTEEPTYFDGCL